ncbi:uncharacterized protein EI90DRAFT_215406 [Cantharellus anzutake]|uniref:uncharacterized protein n=1 Tax=Cantharellus anzutake TaxID=1750568 RepID=UPI0019037FE9|nr:uncharacterized protein EI90DRAFT_215406 [Cantharellus anzutake]KAF8317020.1 hypothetical protein EI90DRAFT_215406 [Cantharellus anzutake]
MMLVKPRRARKLQRYLLPHVEIQYLHRILELDRLTVTTETMCHFYCFPALRKFNELRMQYGNGGAGFDAYVAENIGKYTRVREEAGGFHEWMDTVRLARQEASAAMDTKLRIWCKKNNWSVRYAREYISKTREFRYHVDEHFCPMDDQTWVDFGRRHMGNLRAHHIERLQKLDEIKVFECDCDNSRTFTPSGLRNHWYEKHYQYP